MIAAPAWRARLAAAVTRLAAGCLRSRRPDWAEAMRTESAHLENEGDQIGWAFGCLRASFISGDPMRALYPLALLAGVMLMIVYQWSADESVFTVGLMALLSLGLGVARPGREIVTGLCVGLVVTAVVAFEAVTGLRPAYETHAHSLMHSLRWSVFLLPALAAAAVGGQVGRWLRPSLV